VLDLSGYGLCFHGSNSTADILRVIVFAQSCVEGYVGRTRNKGTNTQTHTHTQTGLGNYRLRIVVGQANDKCFLYVHVGTGDCDDFSVILRSGEGDEHSINWHVGCGRHRQPLDPTSTVCNEQQISQILYVCTCDAETAMNCV
jgi:hypothetical protein